MRWKAVVTATLALLVTLPGQASANAPLHQFGMSDGGLTDATATGQDGYVNKLATIEAVLGNTTNSFFRGAVHWAPTQTAGPSFSKYDPVILQAWQDGIKFLPEIHTSLAGGGGYIDPTSCSGPGCGDAAFENGVYSFAARYGPGGPFALAHPGFVGISRFEVWNEPNTPTGNANSNSGADLAPATTDRILHDESSALVAAATAGGWLNHLQIVCCALGNPGGSHAYALAYLQEMLAVPGNTVWADVSPAGARAGIVTTHQYMQGDPSTCDPAGPDGPKCIQYEQTIRSWLDSQGQTAVGLGITEGGFSGIDSTCTNMPPNVTSEANQAAWDSWAINWIQSHPALKFKLLAFYYILDDSRGAYSCNGAYDHTLWQSGLAPVNGDGSFKPWGSAYHQIVATANP